MSSTARTTRATRKSEGTTVSEEEGVTVKLESNGGSEDHDAAAEDSALRDNPEVDLEENKADEVTEVVLLQQVEEGNSKHTEDDLEDTVSSEKEEGIIVQDTHIEDNSDLHVPADTEGIDIAESEENTIHEHIPDVECDNTDIIDTQADGDQENPEVDEQQLADDETERDDNIGEDGVMAEPETTEYVTLVDSDHDSTCIEMEEMEVVDEVHQDEVTEDTEEKGENPNPSSKLPRRTRTPRMRENVQAKSLIVYPCYTGDLLHGDIPHFLETAKSHVIKFTGKTNTEKQGIIYARFHSAELVNEAGKKMSSTKLPGRNNLTVKSGGSRAILKDEIQHIQEMSKGKDDPEPAEIVVKNIPQNTSENMLKVLFPRAQSIQVSINGAGSDQSYGILKYGNRQEALQVMNERKFYKAYIGSNTLNLHMENYNLYNKLKRDSEAEVLDSNKKPEENKAGNKPGKKSSNQRKRKKNKALKAGQQKNVSQLQQNTGKMSQVTNNKRKTPMPLPNNQKKRKIQNETRNDNQLLAQLQETLRINSQREHQIQLAAQMKTQRLLAAQREEYQRALALKEAEHYRQQKMMEQRQLKGKSDELQYLEILRKEQRRLEDLRKENVQREERLRRLLKKEEELHLQPKTEQKEVRHWHPEGGAQHRLNTVSGQPGQFQTQKAKRKKNRRKGNRDNVANAGGLVQQQQRGFFSGQRFPDSAQNQPAASVQGSSGSGHNENTVQGRFSWTNPANASQGTSFTAPNPQYSNMSTYSSFSDVGGAGNVSYGGSSENLETASQNPSSTSVLYNMQDSYVQPVTFDNSANRTFTQTSAVEYGHHGGTSRWDQRSRNVTSYPQSQEPQTSSMSYVAQSGSSEQFTGNSASSVGNTDLSGRYESYGQRSTYPPVQSSMLQGSDSRYYQQEMNTPTRNTPMTRESSQKSTVPNKGERSVIISNLPNTTVDKLKEFFISWMVRRYICTRGEDPFIDIKPNYDLGKPALTVEFTEATVAKYVVSEMNGVKFLGSNLDLRMKSGVLTAERSSRGKRERFRSKEQESRSSWSSRGKVYTVYVGNVPLSTQEELRSFFLQNILQLGLESDQSFKMNVRFARERKFQFLEFDNRDLAKEIPEAMYGMNFKGNVLSFRYRD